MSRRVVAVLVAIGTLCGCEFDEHIVAPTERSVIVHSVLNPFAADCKVLVEELLTGRVTIDPDEPFRDFDPIATGSGVPIGGARVVLYNESGDSAIAVEEVLVTRSTGVYRFQNTSDPIPSAMLLLPGARYRLRVTTPAGSVVTGTALIPGGTSGESPPAFPFNRDVDTLKLSWSRAEAARTYLVRVNSPRGPYHIFSDSTSIRMPGLLRDFFSEKLPSVFVPGFTQTVLVSAVDSNFYDYYRSQNNPFTGTGLINHLQGGSGLFGALVPLETRTLVTVARQERPVEGEYTADVAFASNAPNRLTLYIESERKSLATLTGNYDRQASIDGGGVLGFQNGASVSLAFLRDNLASDTLSTYAGTLFGGDSIVGAMRATGERIVYRKSPPPSAFR